LDEAVNREERINDNITELIAREKNDPVASFLGMSMQELSPGYARIAMEVKPEYLNFQGLVFGGIIMALADQAFGYGCNSIYYPSVATQFNTHILAAAQTGDRLIAECRVVKSGRRVGLSEITVTNQEGKLIAKATGTSIPAGEQ